MLTEQQCDNILDAARVYHNATTDAAVLGSNAGINIKRAVVERLLDAKREYANAITTMGIVYNN